MNQEKYVEMNVAHPFRDVIIFIFSRLFQD